MKRVGTSPEMRSLLISTRRVAVENNASAALILADVPFEFSEFKQILKKVRILVATDKEEVAEAAKEDGLVVVAAERQLAPLDDKVQALARTRPIADDVAQAEDALDGSSVDIRQHRLERLKISVNVRYNRKHNSANQR